MVPIIKEHVTQQGAQTVEEILAVTTGAAMYGSYGEKASPVNGPSGSYTYGYNGLGDRLQQVSSGVTTRYVLDLNNDLAQVLSDGSNTYLYGLDRIAQQNIVGRQYYLGDALGSVRQLVNPVGAVILARSYEPFRKLLSTAGSSLGNEHQQERILS
jgi:hypothetical protein